MAFGRVLGQDPSATAVQIARTLFGEGPMVSALRDRMGPAKPVDPALTPKLRDGFAAGTRIATPTGLRAVETLVAGDLVETQDSGPQRVRRIERVRLSARGAHAPIRIAAGAHGAERDLLLAPQQRVLVRDPVVEMLFGEAEVLVAARSLVDGEMVTRCLGGKIDYVRILFDRSHVVFAEGLPSECFRPGPRTTDTDAPQADTPVTDADPAPRRVLRNLESQMMRKLVI